LVKKIKKGEEISYNYGYDIEEFEDHPCRCGTDSCVRYIVDKDHWPELKRILSKKNNF